MSHVTIRVENLSKQYKIGQRERYKSLRDSLTDAFTAPFRRLAGHPFLSNGGQQQTDNWIWALKDVSFEVKRGEAVGVIGRNGAGKSTLLKILSRITEPTEGEVAIRGRVGSLLEVGTGFHPELTGRENIFLNGAILGMKRAELERKFDEIVSFAEVEKFIDTPVKHYSSGMYVRLAFAVAAHLEPEILLVDEVLAVGDAAFQKKCLGKMGEVANEGRTVLFVSHSMPSIMRLCSRGIWLGNGRLVEMGEIHNVVAHYQDEVLGVDSTESSGMLQGRRKFFSDELLLQSCVLQDSTGKPVSDVPFGEGGQFIVQTVCNCSRLSRAEVTLWITTEYSDMRFVVLSSGEISMPDCQPGDSIETAFQLPDLRLMPGIYYIGMACKVGGAWTEIIYEAQTFRVRADGQLFQDVGSDFGPVRIDHRVFNRLVGKNRQVSSI